MENLSMGGHHAGWGWIRSATTIISQTTLDDIVDKKKEQKLKPIRVRFRDYQGNNIPSAGSSKFFVKYGQFAGYLPLVISKGSLPSLLGLDWFASLRLGVTGIHATTTTTAKDL
ncbi:hypothetical protein E2320_005247, partial [Naja naja]